MSSGLISTAEDETDHSDDRSGSGHKDKRLSIDLVCPEHRHSLPGNLPTSKMSDIEEGSSSARDDIEVESPMNSSGIRIIIEEGLESDGKAHPQIPIADTSQMEIEEGDTVIIPEAIPNKVEVNMSEQHSPSWKLLSS